MNNPGAMPCEWQDQTLGTASRGKILRRSSGGRPFLPQAYGPERTFCRYFLSVDFFCRLFSSLSESFFMVKGAALFLQQGNSAQGQRSLQHPHKHAGSSSNHRLKCPFPLALPLPPSPRTVGSTRGWVGDCSAS